MKIIKILILFFTFLILPASSNESSFNSWLNDFRKKALQNNISEETFTKSMSHVIFLPKVIKYDRYQPEFYENTKTYISKRTSDKKIKQGIKVYKKESYLINSIDKRFSVEKSLLLALMGIETNFGTYVGKMDILSSLSTLSYDKRRREFFTSELITLLQLVEKKIISHNVLYGSWAGAFGNFQFMPSTIKNYAIDYDQNKKIELKSTKDSFASAANYLNKIGWKKNQPCFIKVDLSKDTPVNILNTSAKNLINKKKFKEFKKYIINNEKYIIDDNLISAIITPDKDIVENSNSFSPAYVVFENYDIILQWNRSLRFALAVCTLKDKFENVL